MSLLRLLSLVVPLMLFAAAPPAQAHERAELEQMLAPIALYPDSVLSHVLIAATYPDQVSEAARWSRAHPKLEGEAAVDAVEDYDWDASVKALVAFPEVLARMDEDPEWTDELGDAFLEHEGEVMDSVQHLRSRAYEAGRLDSLDNVRVVREREYIYIEPAVHGVVFVPYYDPWWVYGSWWWPYYPPYCWTSWYGRPVSYYGSSWYWGIGFHVRPAFYFTTFYWPERHVVVTRHYDRPLYSGRDVSRHQDVRHWRQEPSARRHADRPPGVERREERREQRGVERRPDRRDDRPDARGDERRRDERQDQRQNERQDERPSRRQGERQDRRREPAAAATEEPRHEPRDDRRERMERRRQQRDAGREGPSSDTEAAPARGSSERAPGQGRRRAGNDPVQSDRQRPEQREEAAAARRPESPGRREEAQGRREEAPRGREEAQGQSQSRREEPQQGRREEVGEERDQGGRAQGRQNRDRSERGRSQREDRSRR